MYTKNMYPQFSDIRVAHFDGLNPVTVLEDVLKFIDDHPTFRWIDSHVDYFQPPCVRTPVCKSPEESMWVEVTLIYTT